MGNQRILDARVEADFTQERLADAARVSVTTIVRAERGERISALCQARIARVLGFPRHQLFAEEASA